MKNIKYLVFIAFFLGGIRAQGQNGWVRKAKGFYSQVTLSTFSSKDYHSTDGTLFNAGSTFNSRALLFFGEYGITDRFTVVLDVPLVMLNRFSTTETVGGVGNIKLGLKYGLFKSLPVSLEVDLEIPTNDGINLSSAKEPNSLGIVEQINLPTSDGEFNFWTTLAASQSTSDGKTFGSLFSSINFRTESFSHQFLAGLEFGHLFFDKLYLIGKLKIQEKLSSDLNQGTSFLYGEGTTFTTYGLTSMYKLDSHWRVVASFSDYTDLIIARRNIYDGFTFSLGVALEY